MPAYDNMAVAAKLDLAADLLEISGADKFRFLSYRRAANAVRAWPEQVAALANQGRLTDIPGVGAKMAASIEQIIATGTFGALDSIAEKVPPGLARVKRIPGVGPKRSALLHEKLGVVSLEDLERAVSDGSVARMRGFGAKTAVLIGEGLESFRRRAERTPIGEALPVAEQLATEIAALPGVDRTEIVGSLRRRAETVGNIDMLVSAHSEADGVAAAIAALPAVERELERSADRLILELHDGLRLDVRIVMRSVFGAALQYYTGSIAHNAALATVALSTGACTGPECAASEEDEIYAAIGLQVPPPELREGEGEIEAAATGTLPELITLTDVLGDLQSHSTFTDGRGTLAANRAMAAELGYEYLAVTDHAYALRMVGGLDRADLERQWAEIDELNESPGPRLLKGIELNIADDGSLDYDDDVLARFDIVLASLHSGWDQDEATVTARALRALQHPLVDILAHPTGRVLGRRDPMRLNMQEVLAAAGETGTIVEINSYPDRLDLSAEHIRIARRSGVRFSLGTDAHSPTHFRFMRYGVAQARRGWVQRRELLNAQSWDVARTWLKRRATIA